MNNCTQLDMFIIGGEIYDDEEIMGIDAYELPIYEQDPEEYIYEDEYDALAIAIEDKLQLSSVIIPV